MSLPRSATSCELASQAGNGSASVLSCRLSRMKPTHTAGRHHTLVGASRALDATLRVAAASLAIISVPRVALAHVGGGWVFWEGGALFIHAIVCLVITASRVGFLGKASNWRSFWVFFLTTFFVTPIVLVPLVYMMKWEYDSTELFAQYRIIGAIESGACCATYPFILAIAAAMGWYLSKPRPRQPRGSSG